MWANIIYMILVVIKCISIVVITFLFQKQIDELNKQINDLRGQSMKLALKLYSIQNDTFSNRKSRRENVKK